MFIVRINIVWGNLFGTDTSVGTIVVDRHTSAASKLGSAACSFHAINHEYTYEYNKHHVFRHFNWSSIAMGGTDAQVCSRFVDGLRANSTPWFVVFRGSLLTFSKSGC